MKILLSTSSRTLENALVKFLTAKGFVVRSAFDGVQSLEKLATESFDCVVAELFLPRLSGEEVIKNAKALGAFTVALTDSSQIEAEDLLRCPADLLLPKPFRAETLAAALRKAQREEKTADGVLFCADGTVRCGDKTLSLTLPEYDLLFLSLSQRQVTPEEIKERTKTGQVCIEPRVVVQSLDQKLAQAGFPFRYRNVPQGYETVKTYD